MIYDLLFVITSPDSMITSPDSMVTPYVVGMLSPFKVCDSHAACSLC